MTERGRDLETYLRDGTYEVASTYRRPTGDTVVMLRSRPPREPGVCSSIWVSLRDPQDMALLRCPRADEEQEATAAVDSKAPLTLAMRRLSPFTLLRGLFT